MDKKYNTNLASEFYVMSMLYRIGLDAYLTLGNKKGVDILVKKNDGSTVKIEVKGVNNKTDDWPLSSTELSDDSGLYYIFISYESEIQNLNMTPLWRKCSFPTPTGASVLFLAQVFLFKSFLKIRNHHRITCAFSR